jgi:peptidyl-prolyl cis-trans isomerase D
MISWIQRNFQRHFRSIFALMLVAMVIPFIFTIGSTPGLGRAENRSATKPFFSYNLASSDDQHRIFGDAQLSIFLHYGSYGLAELGSGSRLQNYGLARTATLALADQLQIPAPSEDVLTSYVKTMGAFSGENGEFDASRYNDFRDQQLWTKLNPQLTPADVTRVLSDDWRSDQVRSILGGPGYVLPGDIKAKLAREDTQWTLKVATVDYAKYDPAITPSPAAIKNFYDSDPTRYNVPARVSVDYIAFPAADFVSQMTVTNDDVQAYYDSHRSQFPRPAGLKKPAKPDAAADFAAVRPQVETALKLERAQQAAAQAASDFALALYNEKINGFTPQLDTLLTEHHLTRKSLPPFSRDVPPAELGTGPDAADAAFKLGPDRFFSDALSTPKGSAILLWKETLPAYTPPLTEVQAKVTADCKESERRRLFINQLGPLVHDQLAARIKAGDDFEKAVAATNLTTSLVAAPATGIRIEQKTFPPFTLRQRPPKDLDPHILDSLSELEVNQVFRMIPVQDKGYFVYLAAKKVPDLSEANPQFAATRGELAATTAQQTAAGALSDIISGEQKKSGSADLP